MVGLSPTPRAALGRGSRIAVRALGILGLLTFSFMLTFVISDAASRTELDALEPPGSTEARIGAEHPGEAVHITGAIVALTIGVTGLLGLVIAPDRAGSAYQTLSASLAMLLAIVISGNPDNQGGQAGIVDPAFLVMAIPPLLASVVARPWSTGRGAARRPSFFLMALVGLPGFLYGFQQVLMQRNTWPPKADPHHQAHWYAMAVTAFIVVLVVAGAGLPGRGWRTAAITGGVGAVAVGSASLIDPLAGSALPTWGAVVGVGWGLAVLSLTYKANRLRSAAVKRETY